MCGCMHACVCIFTCMWACVCILVYLCMSMHVYAYSHECGYTCIYMFTCVWACVHMHDYMCVGVHVYACSHVCGHACFMQVYMCVDMRVYAGSHMCGFACVYQWKTRVTSAILLNSSPIYLLRQGLSLKPHLANWATLANQFPLSMPCLWDYNGFMCKWLHLCSIYIGGRDPNTYTTFILSSEPSPQPTLWKTYSVQGICLCISTCKSKPTTTTNPKLTEFVFSRKSRQWLFNMSYHWRKTYTTEIKVSWESWERSRKSTWN
jgi:hypothetical protein